MKKNKVRAYTIIEILITMVITSVIVSILYLLFSTLSRQYSQFNKSQNKTITLALFKNTLKRDFYMSDVLFFKSNELTCVKDKETILYTLQNEFVTRKLESRNTIDTFDIQIKHINPFFIVDRDFKVLKNLSLKVSFLGRKTGLYFSKNYPSNVLTNQKFFYGD
ncbi:PulJ/GspJ family protein [Tenacibaculum sp. nBUS_03]|uniref:PulJ/GspJ family protein n=1 Tax=Tenacibaculum sp. nBUS_03 TaxID=3395320 RepID=UPI003EBDC8AE